jgi:hypothetical protein
LLLFAAVRQCVWSEQIHKALGPTLGYLYRLRERMPQVGVEPSDPCFARFCLFGGVWQVKQEGMSIINDTKRSFRPSQTSNHSCPWKG